MPLAIKVTNKAVADTLGRFYTLSTITSCNKLVREYEVYMNTSQLGVLYLVGPLHRTPSKPHCTLCSSCNLTYFIQL